MSEWSESFGGNKKSFVLWGAITAIAILKYLYESKCGRRRQVEAPVEQDERDAQARNKAAEERLIHLLNETTEVSHMYIFGA